MGNWLKPQGRTPNLNVLEHERRYLPENAVTKQLLKILNISARVRISPRSVRLVGFGGSASTKLSSKSQANLLAKSSRLTWPKLIQMYG
jgi:hypothetical protein